MRHLYVGSLALALAFGSLAAACMERVDSGEDMAARRARAAERNGSGDDDDDTDAGAVSSARSGSSPTSATTKPASTTTSATTTPCDGGTCAATTDGGTAAAAPTAAAIDPFAGAPAYVQRTASSTHNAGKDCMGGCHNHGFTFAGTLLDANGSAVAGAEVRLVDSQGQAILVNTDSSGNFHSSQTWTGPAHVGARTDANKAIMTTALKADDGGCNGCHATGGAVPPIHVP